MCLTNVRSFECWIVCWGIHTDLIRNFPNIDIVETKLFRRNLLTADWLYAEDSRVLPLRKNRLRMQLMKHILCLNRYFRTPFVDSTKSLSIDRFHFDFSIHTVLQKI